MKAMNTIIKILTALAAIAGVVYIVATYGEQIVAWCKKTLESLLQKKSLKRFPLLRKISLPKLLRLSPLQKRLTSLNNPRHT